jgi:putative lipoprotein
MVQAIEVLPEDKPTLRLNVGSDAPFVDWNSFVWDADARFEGGTVSGKSGCNQYNAAYTLSGSSLTVGEIASTKMLCDQYAMDAEQAYLAALKQSATYTAEGGKLTIYNKDGKEVVRYTEAK